MSKYANSDYWNEMREKANARATESRENGDDPLALLSQVLPEGITDAVWNAYLDEVWPPYEQKDIEREIQMDEKIDSMEKDMAEPMREGEIHAELHSLHNAVLQQCEIVNTLLDRLSLVSRSRLDDFPKVGERTATTKLGADILMIFYDIETTNIFLADALERLEL